MSETLVPPYYQGDYMITHDMYITLGQTEEAPCSIEYGQMSCTKITVYVICTDAHDQTDFIRRLNVATRKSKALCANSGI